MQDESQHYIPKNLKRALRVAGFQDLRDALGVTATELCALPGIDSGDFASIALNLSDAGLTFSKCRSFQPLPLLRSVAGLGLKRRTITCMNRAGVTTIEQLLDMRPAAMMQLRNFGAECLVDVYLVLDSFGLQLERPMSSERSTHDDDLPLYCQDEKDALARAADELGSVIVHLTPDATVRDVLMRLPDDLLDQPAACLLTNPPETSALSARVASWRASLSERERHVVDRRLPLVNRDSLEAIGVDLDLTRERVRQIERSALALLAKDPLVLALVESIAELAPVCSIEQLRAFGLDLDLDTGAVLAIARHTRRLGMTAEILPDKVLDENVIVIGYSNAGQDVEDFLSKLMFENKDLRFGTLDRLSNALIDGLTSPDGPLRSLDAASVGRIVHKVLGDPRLWKEGTGTTLFADDQRYVYLSSKASAIESRILLEEAPMSLKELEGFYDAAFPNGAEEVEEVTADRRVTYLLYNNEDIVRTGDGLWSHKNLGAEARLILKDQMAAALERAGGELSLNTLIQQMISINPTFRPETVTTYAYGGVCFQVQGGIVSARTGPPSGDPSRNGNMFKVLNGEHEGCWSWQNIYSREQMYKSSTSIPTALAGLLEVSINGDTVISFPTGVATSSCSAAMVYLHSKGGFRQVLTAAGVEDGDRYRIIVLGPRSAICERLGPIGKSNPVQVLTSTLGLPAETDPSDLVPEALGLDPYSYQDQDLIDRVSCRSAEFSQAYFAINPVDQ